MKRWFPPLFVAFALLANVVERVSYARFLDERNPGAEYGMPPWIALFAFFSIPLGLILFGRMWRPSPEQRAALPKYRRFEGYVLLALTLLLWLGFLYRASFAAWLTATPVVDPAYWERQYAFMANCAALTLGLGGLLSLWLMGIRMPPRNGDDMK